MISAIDQLTLEIARMQRLLDKMAESRDLIKKHIAQKLDDLLSIGNMSEKVIREIGYLKNEVLSDSGDDPLDFPEDRISLRLYYKIMEAQEERVAHAIKVGEQLYSDMSTLVKENAELKTLNAILELAAQDKFTTEELKTLVQIFVKQKEHFNFYHPPQHWPQFFNKRAPSKDEICTDCPFYNNVIMDRLKEKLLSAFNRHDNSSPCPPLSPTSCELTDGKVKIK